MSLTEVEARKLFTELRGSFVGTAFENRDKEVFELMCSGADMRDRYGRGPRNNLEALSLYIALTQEWVEKDIRLLGARDDIFERMAKNIESSGVQLDGLGPNNFPEHLAEGSALWKKMQLIKTTHKLPVWWPDQSASDLEM